MGKIKEIKVPKIIEVPIKIETIPKYIGCRLILKGPEIIKEEGFLWGLTVVFSFLNILSVIKFIVIPKIINNIPIKL